jgi:hypothetical protein
VHFRDQLVFSVGVRYVKIRQDIFHDCKRNFFRRLWRGFTGRNSVSLCKNGTDEKSCLSWISKPTSPFATVNILLHRRCSPTWCELLCFWDFWGRKTWSQITVQFCLFAAIWRRLHRFEIKKFGRDGILILRIDYLTIMVFK